MNADVQQAQTAPDGRLVCADDGGCGDVACERRCAVAEERRLDEHVRAMVAAWPPLTRRQRERLALLLRPRR